MKRYILNYYPSFKCVAGKCRHTCCAGWEIQIDQQTLADYKNHSLPFSEALNKGINYKKSVFKTDRKGRCAFLNEKGLCEIIINLGEDRLCQVCRDHPRFRTFFNDRIEMGLGFCCEQATRIILSFKDKIQPTLILDDSKDEQLDFNQKNIIEFRECALNIAQDTTKNVNDRIDSLLCLCRAKFAHKDLIKTVKKFSKFERVDKLWVKRLKNLNYKIFNTKTSQNLAHYAEQFLVNSIYRHLYDAEDTIEVRARVTAIIICWWLIKNIIEQENLQESFNAVIDVVRAFSVEVEYSQKNTNKLFSFAKKFISV